MKHSILYFTGTGNSLWVSRLLQEKLADSSLIPILSNPAVEGLRDSSTVGVVFPVYMHRMPYIVADFLAKLPDMPYLYAVAVNGGEIGRAFSFFAKQLPAGKRGLKAGFSVTAPSNYLPFGEAPKGEELDRILASGAEKVEQIADVVTRQDSYFDPEDGFFQKNIYPGLLYSVGYKYLNYMDKNFSADESCTSCGRCVEVCPVGNISLAESGSPVWGKNCQMCFACINLCPADSIQYGDKTRGLRRYRNPKVPVADIVRQKQI